MKISATFFLATLATASAFAPQAAKPASMALRMSEPAEPAVVPAPAEPIMQAIDDGSIEEASEPVIMKAVAAEPTMSASLPFMARPAALDGSVAGDVGFDPLGFAKSEQDLMNYREAEIKHARLAMLAAAGWPMSELLDKKIASTLSMAPVVDATDRAPSILNGGLGKISPVYWVGCLLMASAVEAYGLSQKGKADYFPGNLGFDPLGMYPSDQAGQQKMQLAEIKNGRLAMIAITAFAVQEAVYKLGVVDETPIFFKPLTTVISEYANSGYIAH